MVVDAETRFCTGCGVRMEASWSFCPRCGTTGAGRLSAVAQPDELPLAARIHDLVDADDTKRAEAILRLRLAETPDVQAYLLLAELLVQSSRYTELETVLDDAVELAPDNAYVRLRRAEYYGRLGILGKAQDEFAAARRHAPANDVPMLLACNEMDRWLREKSRGAFIRHSELPGWMQRLARRRPQQDSGSDSTEA